MSVTGLVVLLALLAVPYVALNLRRLSLGRSWAFTVCLVAKEWEQRDRAKRKPARAADRLSAGTHADNPRRAGTSHRP
jgi:hypothetical protein